ncbi:hypothetical protein DICSQDRAFT_164689 [Dichomitus squalens LYAD-421 SS1]|nr:uncharacterized protein DICSQDRAFT_164689 [Dichomitus squalens LYAD-421 SS1]EJF66847.1 hypothetical protein DICSQDRAFT_164689 [Dichomitus squalens LYAD-421 SS1]
MAQMPSGQVGAFLKLWVVIDPDSKARELASAARVNADGLVKYDRLTTAI